MTNTRPLIKQPSCNSKYPFCIANRQVIWHYLKISQIAGLLCHCTQRADKREQNTRIRGCANMAATSHTSDCDQADLGFNSSPPTWKRYGTSQSVGFVFHKMGIIIELNNRTHPTLPILVLNSCDHVYKVFRTENIYSLSEVERPSNRTNDKHKAGADHSKSYTLL